MKYRLINKNREVYEVEDAGEIGRPKINLKPSGQWRAVALVRFSNFGQVVQRVPFEDWEEFVKQDVLWRYKNGKPRYFLEDWDHGTVRLQTQGVVDVSLAQK